MFHGWKHYYLDHYFLEMDNTPIYLQTLNNFLNKLSNAHLCVTIAHQMGNSYYFHTYFVCVMPIECQEAINNRPVIINQKTKYMDNNPLENFCQTGNAFHQP